MDSSKQGGEGRAGSTVLEWGLGGEETIGLFDAYPRFLR